jgi:hypothetical protein
MSYQQAKALEKELEAENPGKHVFTEKHTDNTERYTFYTVTIYHGNATLDQTTHINFDRSYPQHI